MYLAMSRLQVVFGKENEFEIAWKGREQETHGVKGFRKFNLFKGKVNNESTLYIFHSEWNTESDFFNWTKSDSFQLAHKSPTLKGNLYLGLPSFSGYVGFPDFEGFKVVI